MKTCTKKAMKIAVPLAFLTIPAVLSRRLIAREVKSTLHRKTALALARIPVALAVLPAVKIGHDRRSEH
ncbi:MAG TPA: hypothetical protein VMH50_18745 [Thermoleophilia bacterium]|nr:hypothetical protein [Thermoleophilia bacterium]